VRKRQVVIVFTCGFNKLAESILEVAHGFEIDAVSHSLNLGDGSVNVVLVISGDVDEISSYEATVS
jgi:hypothetical protein